ncbi:putative reverse transcriptase domain-containing protein [Tanacetum coccineum]
MAVSSPFEGLSDIGSSRVDEPPMMPKDPYAYVVAAFQAPPSPDYVPGSEEPKQAPLSPEFVPEPVYPEFMPSEDDVFPAEEQPLPATVSPTIDSLGYITDSDPEEYEEDPEEDPIDYPEDDDEEEEEHPSPVDFVLPPVHRVTARMSIRAQTPISLPSDIEVARLLAIPTPPPSPLSLLSSPLPPILSPLPQILSPPLLVSSPSLPASPTYPLRYRSAMIRLRAETPFTSNLLPLSTPPSGTPPLLPISLPTPSPPLLFPSTDCRAVVSKVSLPPRKRLCIALGLRYEVGKSSSAPTTRPTAGFRVDYGFVATLDDEIRRDPKRYVGYGITDTWDDMVEDMQGTPTETNVEGLSQRMTNFVTTVRQDTNEIYVRLDDAQDDRLLMSGRLNMLHRERRAHAHTALLMKRKARLSREAWVRSIDASGTARSKKMAPKRTIRANPADTTTTTSVTNTQLKAMIDQGVTDALAARALTWWNSHVRTVGHDVAYAMTWADLKKKMTDKYCPRGEIKKLETELWNLKVKGTDVIGYNQRFQELALLCVRMFPEESDKIKRHVSGLPDMIHGSVVALKPKTMQEAIEIATELMDKKIRTFAERQTENKRKQDDNQQQQQQNKRQNTGRAYTAGSGEKKPYVGSKPLCPKCNYHHDGPCAPKCHKCNRVGHLAQDCRSPANTNASNNQKGTKAGQKPTCYECGA